MTRANVEELHTLVARAQAGDLEAYAAIVRRFQDMAVGYGYSLLGDLHLAEDAAQEAFASAYRDLAQLRQPAAFPGWFRTIVFKHCDRLIRRRQPATLPLEAAAELPAGGDGPAETAERRATRDQVIGAIQSLPGHEREVVALFYISEYTQAEIGGFLGLPVSTVKNRLHAARRHLQERMLSVIQDNLSEQRPSRDERFAERVMQLFQASAGGDTHAVKRLLDAEPALATASGPMHEALYIGDVQPLHVAVMYQRKDVIDLLIAQGADINAKDTQGMTALQHALDLGGFLPDYDAPGMVAFLRSRGAQDDIYTLMWSGSDAEFATFLREHPEAANTKTLDDATPLCLVGSVKRARLLLAHGADLHARIESDSGMSSAIQFVARFPKSGVLRFLLEQADIAIDPFFACVLGETAAVIAAIQAEPSLTQARTGAGHALGEDIALLHLAIHYGHEQVATLLLDQGADIDMQARSAFGGGTYRMGRMTPLHVAATRGQAALARLLIARGADTSARDERRGLTPRALAEAVHDDEIQRAEVIALLREIDAPI
jgi:RNA polymerase sigma factor (sigma-70 family)